MSDEFDWTDELLGRVAQQPSLAEIRARASQHSSAVEELLRSDRRGGAGPTRDQAGRVGDARRLVAAAEDALQAHA